MEKQYDIRPRRNRVGISQAELAAKLDIHPAALAAVEDGRITIDEQAYHKAHEAITQLEAEKGKVTECADESLASAST